MNSTYLSHILDSTRKRYDQFVFKVRKLYNFWYVIRIDTLYPISVLEPFMQPKRESFLANDRLRVSSLTFNTCCPQPSSKAWDVIPNVWTCKHEITCHISSIHKPRYEKTCDIYASYLTLKQKVKHMFSSSLISVWYHDTNIFYV